MDWPLTASESGKHFQTQEDSWFELSSAFGSFAISGSDLEACFVTPSVISTFSVCNISNFALQTIRSSSAQLRISPFTLTRLSLNLLLWLFLCRHA